MTTRTGRRTQALRQANLPLSSSMQKSTFEYVQDAELSEQEAIELLRTIWDIVVGFVDLGFPLLSNRDDLVSRLQVPQGGQLRLMLDLTSVFSNATDRMPSSEPSAADEDEEEFFELALGFLSNPHRFWISGRSECQKLALRLTFSERLAWDAETGFRTPKTTMPFSILGDVDRPFEGMAERKGFEPLRRFPAYTLSRRAPSTTRPPLRIQTCRHAGRLCA